MAKYIYEAESSYHNISNLSGEEINRRLKEDPYEFNTFSEGCTFNTLREARAEICGLDSQAEMDGDILQVGLLQIFKGKAVVDEEASAKYGEEILYAPELEMVETVPFDGESLRVLRERGIDETLLLL